MCLLELVEDEFVLVVLVVLLFFDGEVVDCDWVLIEEEISKVNLFVVLVVLKK